MIGGAGDDNYLVDAAGDTVSEAAGGGIDTVNAWLSYTLGAEIEHLSLGPTGALNGTGNALANSIRGNDQSNRLDGGAGADTLIGQNGDDIYVVDNVADVIVEGSGFGLDSVESSVSYTLPAAIENLTLTGAAAINATGNMSTNVLTGNSAANRLDGGAGADTMIGGGGDDIYVVDKRC